MKVSATKHSEEFIKIIINGKVMGIGEYYNFEFSTSPENARMIADSIYKQIDDEPESDDYSDNRPDGIVESNASNGEHYSEPCDCGNNSIYSELYAKEPEKPGLYLTQSGIVLFKMSHRVTFPWLLADGEWAGGTKFESWENVINQLDESELPLIEAKAVAE